MSYTINLDIYNNVCFYFMICHCVVYPLGSFDKSAVSLSNLSNYLKNYIIIILYYIFLAYCFFTMDTCACQSTLCFF